MNNNQTKCYEILQKSYPQNSQHITAYNISFSFFKLKLIIIIDV